MIPIKMDAMAIKANSWRRTARTRMAMSEQRATLSRTSQGMALLIRRVYAAWISTADGPSRIHPEDTNSMYIHSLK